MTHNELKPCPLCGAAVRITEIYSQTDNLHIVLKCDCGLTFEYEQSFAVHEKRSTAGQLLEIVRVPLNMSPEDAWNRRVAND